MKRLLIFLILCFAASAQTPLPSPINGGTGGGGGGTGNQASYTSVSFSATPTFTALSNTVDAWAITLTGNVTSSTLASATTGERLGLKICQDGTGGRTFVWPTGFSAAATISPVASVCTKQEFYWDGSNAVPLGPATADGGPAAFGPEQAAPGTPPAGTYYCWADSTAHTGLRCKANNSATIYTMVSSAITVTQTIASGAKALATSAISSAACSAAQTDTATGTLTTDAITASFNGDPTAVTGYVPLTAGMLTIIAYPTADAVNFKVCNNTTSSITPGAITLNWRVVR